MHGATAAADRRCGAVPLLASPSAGFAEASAVSTIVASEVPLPPLPSVLVVGVVVEFVTVLFMFQFWMGSKSSRSPPVSTVAPGTRDGTRTLWVPR